MVIVVMGVAGAGKTTIGRALADSIGATFLDADDLHPAANVEKMSRGIPLSDPDRWPWLDAVRSRIDAAIAKGENLVVACSALKEAYRSRLQADSSVRFVYLRGDPALFRRRLEERKGHFMPATLLATQFGDLEEPENAIAVDASRSRDEIVAAIRRILP